MLALRFGVSKPDLALASTIAAVVAVLATVMLVFAAEGELTFVEVLMDGAGGVDGLNGAHSMAVSPDGNYLYAAGQSDAAVAVFSRTSTTGALTFVEVQQDGVAGVDGLAAVSSVVVSPDGNHLYAAAFGDDMVSVFSRNSTTGALTFVEFHRDGDGGVDGLNGAWSVTVSPDGNHLYAAGTGDNAVAVFSRNSTTGALTFVEFQQDGAGGVDGLAGAQSVTVSPDGNHLYATGADDDAVVVFSRNSTTGALTFVEVHKDGLAGVDGLEGAFSVSVNPDGSFLYVASSFEDAVAVFSRNSTTGALTFVELHRDGVAGVDGLADARSVTVSPDGKNLYAGGWTDDAVAVFAIEQAPTDLGITNVDSADPRPGNRGLAYTLAVTNNGPNAATGVVVTDTLPAGVVFTSASWPSGVCGESVGTVTCDIGALANGASVVVTVIVQLPEALAGTTITNTALVAATEGWWQANRRLPKRPRGNPVPGAR